ncbi:MAG: transcription antitermination factor NusB [Clostridiales bacterium]|nr:transcription antitermination factor NusB [Clostridiales bacterium]
MKRREVRELVFKTLFACDLGNDTDPFLLLEYITKDREMAGREAAYQPTKLSVSENRYARRLTSGVLSRKIELDEIIGSYSLDWNVERLGGAERSILRMGFYEMLFDEKLPPAIAINEAVDLIKKYGTSEAAKFVNGILGKKAEELPAGNLLQESKEE